VVFDNVIVPFDGSVAGRAVLAPAGDLAWRCGARLVVVSNTGASDELSRVALKGRAITMSGADVDFWVDPGHSMGEALVRSAANRDHPLICVPLRNSKKGLLRRMVTEPMPHEVLHDTEVPLLVIGPEADVSRGLPLSEIVVPLDGGPSAERILPAAVAWAHEFKASLVLLRVVPTGVDDHQAPIRYLSERLGDVAATLPDARFELVEADDEALGIVGYLGDHDSSVVMLTLEPERHGESIGPLGDEVLARSPRALVLVRP